MALDHHDMDKKLITNLLISNYVSSFKLKKIISSF